MSTVTIDLPEWLATALAERMKTSGVRSEEEYVLSLVESDCVAGALERVLEDRMNGPFAVLEPDWKDRVRNEAARRTGG